MVMTIPWTLRGHASRGVRRHLSATLHGWLSTKDPKPCTWRRAYATTNIGHRLEVGNHLHGFTLKRTKQVPELELTAFHLEHDKTGADYLHIARDDKNNVFSIGFKTNPPDDTGVPHILEHTTLCGSQKLVTSILICSKN